MLSEDFIIEMDRDDLVTWLNCPDESCMWYREFGFDGASEPNSTIGFVWKMARDHIAESHS